MTQGVAKSLTHSAALTKFLAEVDLVKGSYRKPRDDGRLRERDFGDQIIRALTANFGRCSAALVGNVLTFVDFQHDDSDLKARIKRMAGSAHRKALVRALRGR